MKLTENEFTCLVVLKLCAKNTSMFKFHCENHLNCRLLDGSPGRKNVFAFGKTYVHTFLSQRRK